MQERSWCVCERHTHNFDLIVHTGTVCRPRFVSWSFSKAFPLSLGQSLWATVRSSCMLFIAIWLTVSIVTLATTLIYLFMILSTYTKESNNLTTFFRFPVANNNKGTEYTDNALKVLHYSAFIWIVHSTRHLTPCTLGYSLTMLLATPSSILVSNQDIPPPSQELGGRVSPLLHYHKNSHSIDIYHILHYNIHNTQTNTSLYKYIYNTLSK